MVFAANVVASFFGSFEPCGPQPWPAQARKHPAIAGRAPQAASESPTDLLCHPERKRRIYLGKVTDSSSIFRSPQNDNAVFALNHFLSGTHSSARPGRLRGSRFQREPAPGARSSDQKEKEPAIIVMLSEAKHLFWARLQILRRYAPQNDKLLNCSQTPQQTGISNWRQRGEVKGKDRCSGRPRLAEINTGFSRASRSPALRRLAEFTNPRS